MSKRTAPATLSPSVAAIFLAVANVLDRIVDTDAGDLAEVLRALQPAEELHGPREADYIPLMRAIGDEACEAGAYVASGSAADDLLQAIYSEAMRRITAAEAAS